MLEECPSPTHFVGDEVILKSPAEVVPGHHSWKARTISDIKWTAARVLPRYVVSAMMVVAVRSSIENVAGDAPTKTRICSNGEAKIKGRCRELLEWCWTWKISKKSGEVEEHRVRVRILSVHPSTSAYRQPLLPTLKSSVGLSDDDAFVLCNLRPPLMSGP